jgi:hypothetical protein
VNEPGLAPQRTRLAWWRTLLALTVVTLLGLRLTAWYGVDAPAVAGAAAALLLWLLALVVTHRRAARWPPPGSAPPDGYCRCAPPSPSCSPYWALS